MKYSQIIHNIKWNIWHLTINRVRQSTSIIPTNIKLGRLKYETLDPHENKGRDKSFRYDTADKYNIDHQELKKILVTTLKTVSLTHQSNNLKT